ncbi:hypothetical protein OH77DRAFT_1419891 [Trametes cingulata]|nr:hypothetical protein OH77DRAFT_1419891 [Trametes cingulata]
MGDNAALSLCHDSVLAQRKSFLLPVCIGAIQPHRMRDVPLAETLLMWRRTRTSCRHPFPGPIWTPQPSSPRFIRSGQRRRQVLQ